MPVEKDLTQSLCTEEAEWRIPVDVSGRLAVSAVPGYACDWLEVCRRARMATPLSEDSVLLLRALRDEQVKLDERG